MNEDLRPLLPIKMAAVVVKVVELLKMSSVCTQPQQNFNFILHKTRTYNTKMHTEPLHQK